MSKSNIEKLAESVVDARVKIKDLKSRIDSSLQEINKELKTFGFKSVYVIGNEKLTEEVTQWVEEEMAYLEKSVQEIEQDAGAVLEDLKLALEDIENTVYGR